MTFKIVKVELETFRGKRPAVQVITLSCSYAEFLHAGRAGGQNDGHVSVRLLQPEPIDAIAHVAMVQPASASAMLTLSEPLTTVQVGAELALAQPGA